MHLGRPWPQNEQGHLLGDVTDQGKAADDPTVARQRDRRHRVPVPLRRLRSRRPVLPRRGRERRRDSSSPTRWRSTTSWSRERPELAAELYDAVPVRLPRRAGAGREALVHDADLHRLGRPAVRALHPPVHRGVAAPRGCAASVGLQREAHGPVGAMCADPDVPRVDDDAARRHAVREQLPRAARSQRVRRRSRRGRIRHLKRLWLETEVLTSRPPYFANRSHWSAKRSASRLVVNWRAISALPGISRAKQPDWARFRHSEAIRAQAA